MSAVGEKSNSKPAPEPPLRTSILSGKLTGWNLDFPPHLHKAYVTLIIPFLVLSF